MGAVVPGGASTDHFESLWRVPEQLGLLEARCSCYGSVELDFWNRSSILQRE